MENAFCPLPALQYIHCMLSCLCPHFKLLLLLPSLFLLLIYPSTGHSGRPRIIHCCPFLLAHIPHLNTHRFLRLLPRNHVSNPSPLFLYHYSSGSHPQLFLHRAKQSLSNWFAGLQRCLPPTLPPSLHGLKLSLAWPTGKPPLHTSRRSPLATTCP